MLKFDVSLTQSLVVMPVYKKWVTYGGMHEIIPILDITRPAYSSFMHVSISP